MGSNKRYAAHYDRLTIERLIEQAALDGPLQTLTPTELELERLPLTVNPKPETVLAWVRFGDRGIRVDALACRWTPRAVGIRFEARGKEYRCWVWASAVERVERDATDQRS